MVKYRVPISWNIAAIIEVEVDENKFTLNNNEMTNAIYNKVIPFITIDYPFNGEYCEDSLEWYEPEKLQQKGTNEHIEAVCLNCGYKFNLIGVSYDKLGWHSTCPKCDRSFDIDVYDMKKAFWHTIQMCEDESAAMDNVKNVRKNHDIDFDMMYEFILKQGLFQLLPKGFINGDDSLFYILKNKQ